MRFQTICLAFLTSVPTVFGGPCKVPESKECQMEGTLERRHTTKIIDIACPIDELSGDCDGELGDVSYSYVCGLFTWLAEDVWCHFQCYRLAPDGSTTQVVITTLGAVSGSVGCENG